MKSGQHVFMDFLFSVSTPEQNDDLGYPPCGH
jgi:hypothetical protein